MYQDNGISAAANVSRHGTFGLLRQCTRTVPNPTLEDLSMQTMGGGRLLGAAIGWFMAPLNIPLGYRCHRKSCLRATTSDSTAKPATL